MNALPSLLAQSGPSLDDQIPRDAPYDLLPEPVSLLLSLAFGVILVLGRNWIADFCESVTGWGPAYRRWCVWFCAIGGVVLVIAVAVEGVCLLL
jgi:hypothetical protein